MANVFDEFNEIKKMLDSTAADLSRIAGKLDAMAAQFGFTRETIPPLPVRPPNPYFEANSIIGAITDGIMPVKIEE